MTDKERYEAMDAQNAGYFYPTGLLPASLGGEGGSGGDSSSMSASAVLSQLIQQYPQLAGSEFDTASKYGPLWAELATKISSKYLPGQSQVSLENAQQFAPKFQNLNDLLISRSRTSDLNDLVALAPLLQKIRGAGEMPESTAMRTKLASDIGGDLARGTKLNSEEMNNITQSFRAAEQSRGVGQGSGSSLREAVARGVEGQRLKDTRQNRASSFLASESTNNTDPYTAILGRNPLSATTALAQQSSPMATPTTANGANTSGILGAYQNALNYSLNSNAQNLQATQYNNMLQYLPYLMNGTKSR